MAPTVADYLLERLRDMGRATRSSPTPATGSTASSPPGAGRTTTRSSSRPGTRRWPRSRPSGTRSSPAGSACAWPPPGPGAIHLLNGLYDAKLDHVPVVAIVGQTNRTAMGGSYQQEVDLLTPVQGRGQRVRADGHGPRAAAQRAGPGHPRRAGRARARPRSSSRPTCRNSSTPRRPTRSRWCPPRIGHRLARPRARRRGDPPGRRDPQRRRARSPSWPGRAPAAPGASSRRSPNCSAPAWPSRCWARTCSPTSCPTSPARSGCWAPGRATR